MVISELIDKLEKIKGERGDISVMLEDGDGTDVWELTTVSWKVTDEDEYPEEWNMPVGFEFVKLSN